MNCWTIAEHAGEWSPDGMQHLLGRAAWDADGVREDLREYVVEHLGDPDAVLVVDETGDLKKGSATVGAQRQYTGTAGRLENAQVTVYLVDAGAAAHAFIDWALYLPKTWTEDEARLREAGVPEGVGFATKPTLARAMIARALDAGTPARWGSTTAHAEILALGAAAARTGGWRLAGTTLMVTLEPCTMCAGALVLARVDRLVFGAWDVKAGAVGSLWDVVRDRRLNHRPEVVSGVLAEDCARLLSDFFESHRTVR